MYDQQIGHPLPLRTSSVFVNMAPGFKSVKTTMPGVVAIARKTKPRLIESSLNGHIIDDAPAHGKVRNQGESTMHGIGDVTSGQRNVGYMNESPIGSEGDTATPMPREITGKTF